MEPTEFGSASAAAKGGKARAASLSKEARSEIARAAAMARHGKPLPKATHEGPLYIGEMEIDCAVLEGPVRVISERAFSRAINIVRGGYEYRRRNEGGGELPIYLSVPALNDLVEPDLRVALSKPILYHPKSTGMVARGVDARLIPRICDVWLRARDKGALSKRQLETATKADILIRGLATVGIIALVDEATGYQYERPRRDLEEQLKKLLSESLVRYASGFPKDYFKHLCRLRGVELRPDMRLPPNFGQLTNDLVYRRIASGLLRALKERRAERGKPSNKLYQWTSEDEGYPALMLHLGTVVGLMKVNTDYETFRKQLDIVAPIRPEFPGLFDKPEDWDDPKALTDTEKP